jgi:transglutaminase-like putative cysteine protease
LSIGLVVAISVASIRAQNPSVLSDVDALAVRTAGEGTVLERTSRLVSWINHDFEWTATDYQQRTPEQIIERRAGNCADLAKVLARLLDAVHVRYRIVREINVQPASDSRQTNAEAKIASGGARFSVFGRRHNDHTWLEVFEPDSSTWMPADPAVGVVGIENWISARLAFSDRRQPVVAATVPIVQTMLVPFAVVAAGTEDRSAYYLIDQFDRTYGGRLHSLPAWAEWCSLVRELAPLAMGAFKGDANLHEHAATIARAAGAYETLRQQAIAAGLTLK